MYSHGAQPIRDVGRHGRNEVRILADKKGMHGKRLICFTVLPYEFQGPFEHELVHSRLRWHRYLLWPWTVCFPAELYINIVKHIRFKYAIMLEQGQNRPGTYNIGPILVIFWNFVACLKAQLFLTLEEMWWLPYKLVPYLYNARWQTYYNPLLITQCGTISDE